MIKNLFYFSFVFILTISSASLAMKFEKENESKIFTPKLATFHTSRPQETQKFIDCAFDSRKIYTFSGWGTYNGSEFGYGLMHLDEIKILKQIIQDHPERKDFYILDIGAGNFAFSYGLAKMINKDNAISSDIKIHLYGVRAEGGTGLGDTQDISEFIGNKCVLHNLGLFKTENLFESLKERNINLKNKFDFIVSRWSFVHFVDPIGTLEQAYDLLIPQSGIILMDSFRLLLQDDPTNESPKNLLNMWNFLESLKVPYIASLSGVQYNSHAGLNFMIKRPHNQTISISMSYINSYRDFKKDKDYTRLVTQYVMPHQFFEELPNEFMNHNNHIDVYGDKSLFEWVAKNHSNWITNEKERTLTTYYYRGPINK